MGANNNIWYLDRGKNFFSKEGQDFFETMISAINTNFYYREVDTNELIEKLPEKFKQSGNCNALLTTIRNIGLINKKNKLGENIKYYLEDKLTYKELILENLTKVNYDKDNTKRVKPFVVLCMVLYELYKIDPEYAFITKDDCINVLFHITNYENNYIYDAAQSIIASNRNYTNQASPVLDIWFNALQEFDIFEKTTQKSQLKVNPKEISFFEYIYHNGTKIPCYSNDQTEFSSVYDEIGSSTTGINYIIPEVELNENLPFNQTTVEEIYNYLFGINPHISYEYFKKPCFALYKPFRTMKNIAIRKIEKSNPTLADALFQYHYTQLMNNQLQ